MILNCYDNTKFPFEIFIMKDTMRCDAKYRRIFVSIKFNCDPAIVKILIKGS